MSTIINLSQIQPVNNLLDFINGKSDFVLDIKDTTFNLKNLQGEKKGLSIEMPALMYKVNGKLVKPLIRLTKNARSMANVKFHDFYDQNNAGKKSINKMFVSIYVADAKDEYTNFALFNYQLTQIIEILICAKIFNIDIKKYEKDSDFILEVFKKFEITSNPSKKYLKGIIDKTVPIAKKTKIDEKLHLLYFVKDQFEEISESTQDKKIKDLIKYFTSNDKGKIIKENFKLSDIEIDENGTSKHIEMVSSNITIIFKSSGFNNATNEVIDKNLSPITFERYKEIANRKLKSIMLATMDLDCRNYITVEPTNGIRLTLKQFNIKELENVENQILIEDCDTVIDDADLGQKALDEFN